MDKTLAEGRVSGAWLACRCVIDFIAICILIGFWWYVRDFIIYRTTKLTLTDKHIIGKVGLVNTEELDSPISKITGVKVEQGLFGKIFNYGTIVVTTASNAFRFAAITNPNQFKSTLSSKLD